MKYNSDILIRNFKLHLLADDKLTSELELLDKRLKSYFKSLIKYKSNMDMYKDLTFFKHKYEEDSRNISSICYIIYESENSNAHLMDVYKICDSYNVFKNIKLTNENFSKFTEWYMKSVLEISFDNLRQTAYIMDNLLEQLYIDLQLNNLTDKGIYAHLMKENELSRMGIEIMDSLYKI